MIPQSLLWPLLWPEILPSLPLRSTPSTTILFYSRASISMRPLGESKILLICPYPSLVFWCAEDEKNHMVMVYVVPFVFRVFSWFLENLEIISLLALVYTPWTMSQPHLWLHRRKWACHVNNEQVSQGCQEGQGSVWFPQSSEIRGFRKSKAWLLAECGAPFSVYGRELSQTKVLTPCDAREGKSGNATRGYSYLCLQGPHQDSGFLVTNFHHKFYFQAILENMQVQTIIKSTSNLMLPSK